MKSRQSLSVEFCPGGGVGTPCGAGTQSVTSTDVVSWTNVVGVPTHFGESGTPDGAVAGFTDAYVMGHPVATHLPLVDDSATKLGTTFGASADQKGDDTAGSIDCGM